MADRLALFKAAKAQRGSSAALTKEQIKALKAQKAKAAAEAEAAAKEAAEQHKKHEAAVKAAAAATSRQRDGQASSRPSTSGAMPPPAPRIPPTSNGAASIGSNPAFVPRRTESQMTRVGRNASIAPEPAGQSNASSGAVHSAQEASAPEGEERSIGSIPQGFFDQPTNSEGPQESVGTGEIVGSNLEVSSEVASALPRGHSVEAMSARTQISGLPNDFFEAGGSNEGEIFQPDVTRQASNQPRETPDRAGLLPKGFFEDKDADAKAHGMPPPKKKTKEEAYADFMTAIASDVKDAEEREQEEAVRAAQDREAREAFEQRMRLERIERLKHGHAALPVQLPQGETIALNLEPSLIPRGKKRKLATETDKQASSGSESESDEEDDLNWRAKAV